MGGNVGKRILILLALALVGMFVIACNDSSEASDAVNTAAPTNPGPAQVVLGDRPVGVAGSRFTDPDVEINLTAEVVDWDILDGETVVGLRRPVSQPCDPCDGGRQSQS